MAVGRGETSLSQPSLYALHGVRQLSGVELSSLVHHATGKS